MNKQEFKKLDREQMIIAFNQLKDDYTNLFNKSVSKNKIKAKIDYYKKIDNAVGVKILERILEEE